MHPLIVAATGASGGVYFERLLRFLLSSGREVYAVISASGAIVLKQEMGWDLMKMRLAEALCRGRGGGGFRGRLVEFASDDLSAPMASGTVKTSGMVVVPCSMKTLAGIAHGFAGDLIGRAADVTLKEGRPLVLVPRETPLSEIHLSNMLSLARSGARIVPAMPGFYHHPRNIEGLVDFVVARILDQLRIEHDLLRPWGGTHE